MIKKVARLFVIKTRWEAYLIIFALANGAMMRGRNYLLEYPGTSGWLLFWACSGAVFLGGAAILDSITLRQQQL
jgi:hypothetical protein